MGLLDKLKPHEKPLRPVEVSLVENAGLSVQWDDGAVSVFAHKWLRARCPCAECVEEWTGQRTVGEAQVKDDVRMQGFSGVGNYAIQPDWSDGHKTGIYSWDYLLKLRREREAQQ
jgi:DUF971 family protein